MLYLDLDKNADLLMKVLSPLDPKLKGDYITHTCPSCFGKEGYTYIKAGWFATINCSHLNNCGRKQKVYEYCDIVEKSNYAKVAELYYEKHGLNLDMLHQSGIVGRDGSINLKKKNDIYYKKILKAVDGKLRFVWNKRGFRKSDGNFLPSIHDGDTLYVFDGIADWLKGVSDGLPSTTSLFGCSSLPSSTRDWAIFSNPKLKKIRVCYDTDKAGRASTPKLLLALKEKQPEKTIEAIDLPFSKEETESGCKDYCDYRNIYSLDQFFQIPANEMVTKITRKDRKRIDDQKRFEQEKESHSHFKLGKILVSVPGEDGATYYVTNKGVFEEKEVVSKEGDSFYKYKNICATPVIVEQILNDMFGGEEHIKVSIHGKEKVYPTRYFWVKNMDKLQGISILSDNAKDMSKYFRYAIDNATGKSSFSTKNGWHENSIIVGDSIIDEKEIKKIDRSESDISIEKDGRLERWKSNVSEWINNDPQIQLACGASVIAPILKKLGVAPFTIHFWAETSKGKSLGAKIASSYWSSPSKIMRNWPGSSAAHESYFSEMNNLPCFLEESQENDNDREVKRTVYYFGNGTGKSRAKRSGDAKEIKKYHSALISTGEFRIGEVSKQSGLTSRLIEIKKEIFHFEKDGSRFRKLYRDLETDYGLAGIEVLQYYMKNKQQVEDWFDSNYSGIEMAIGEQKNSAKIRRVIDYWAAIITGCYINQEVFGFECNQSVLFEQMKESIESIKEYDLGDNLYNELVSFYVSNKNHFQEENHAGFTSACEDRVFGLKRKNTIYFITSTLKERMKDFVASMLSSLKDRIERKGNRNQVERSINGQKVWCVALKLKTEE